MLCGPETLKIKMEYLTPHYLTIMLPTTVMRCPPLPLSLSFPSFFYMQDFADLAGICLFQVLADPRHSLIVLLNTILHTTTMSVRLQLRWNLFTVPVLS